MYFVRRHDSIMKTLCILQHTEAEFLGLLEDHFESRNIRFRYVRPFATGGSVPAAAGNFDGLVLLGAGPHGLVSGKLLPSREHEISLARDFLERGLPVFGIGLGTCLLAMAAGGDAAAAPLRFTVGTARRVVAGALAGHLPAAYPSAVYMRDRPVLPAAATVLAVDAGGEPALFQVGDNSFGFLGHPGVKSAMIEDMVMESDETPDGVAGGLANLRAAQGEFARALGDMVVGMIKMSQLMPPAPHP